MAPICIWGYSKREIPRTGSCCPAKEKESHWEKGQMMQGYKILQGQPSRVRPGKSNSWKWIEEPRVTETFTVWLCLHYNVYVSKRISGDGNFPLTYLGGIIVVQKSRISSQNKFSHLPVFPLVALQNGRIKITTSWNNHFPTSWRGDINTKTRGFGPNRENIFPNILVIPMTIFLSFFFIHWQFLHLFLPCAEN